MLKAEKSGLGAAADGPLSTRVVSGLLVKSAISFVASPINPTP
jgi:hypothetical protein